MKTYALTLFLSLLLLPYQLVARTIDVTTLGAVGDGVHIDSPAINEAIQIAAKEGGGTVVVPSGKYACYSIRLQSHVQLYLEQGARIIAAIPTETEGYDEAEMYEEPYYQDFGHSHWKNSLLWGIGLEDIAIRGEGWIVGSNLTRDMKKGLNGNKAIALRDCRNVTLEGFTMLECGHFALLATGVDNLMIRGLRVDTNRDGFDIDCCHDVHISDCTVNTPWDDAIVLKASYALGRFRDTEKVTITGCTVSGYDCGTMLDGTRTLTGPIAPDRGGRTGRIKLGTESSGGFRGITVTNCIFDHSRGLALETVDGGILEDVVVSDIVMRHITSACLFLRLGARMRSPEGTPLGKLRRVSISNVRAYDVDSRYSSILAGLPDAVIEDVSLSNIHIYHQGGCTLTDQPTEIQKAPWERPGYKEPQTPAEREAHRQEFAKFRNTERDTLLVVNPNQAVPELRDGYPEPWIFGVVPAKGLYLRHLRGLRVNGLHYHFEQPDARPLVVMEDVEDFHFTDISVDGKAWNSDGK